MTRLYLIRFAIIVACAVQWLLVSGQPFSVYGSASSLGNGLCYELTPNAPGQGGSIMSSITIDLTEPWTFTALMSFGSVDGGGADGIVFTLTPIPALGFPGGGIGYAGIAPSIAVEFDTYSNPNLFDPINDHMSIQANGNVDHSSPLEYSGPVDLGNIETGLTYCATITWNPTTQVFYCNFNGYTISYTGDIINNIFGGNPIVHYGFTSATGSAFNGHQICVVPVAPALLEDATICEGETVYFQADPYAITWNWQPDPSLSSTTISNPQADPVTNTTYYVHTTYFCGGNAYDTAVVTIMPDLSGNASNSGPQCEYEDIDLNAWGGESYQWSGPGGYSSNDQNAEISAATPANSGTYYVTITDDNGCTHVASTVVTVYPTPVVSITPIAQSLCEDANPVQLVATPPGGEWGGEVTSTGIFDPGAAGPGDHAIEYFYSDANNCSASDEIIITVAPVPSVSITPITQPVCADSGPIQLNATPAGGTWSGNVSATGIFSPATAGVGDHVISYSYTNASNCTAADVITITVVAVPNITITPVAQPLCADSDPIQVNATPTGGTWNGNISSSGIFTPATAGPGNHVITYSYTDANNCSSTDDITISVVPNTAAAITPSGPFCDETAMVTLTANPAGGIWGGVANSSGQVFPAALNPGMHTVTYTLTTPTACYNTEIQIEVVAATTLVVPDIPDFCEDDANYQVTGFSPPGGTYSGASTPSGLIQPQLLGPGSYQVTYTYDPPVCPVVTASVPFSVFGSPAVQDIEIICDAVAESFTVQFEITGGDPAAYNVDGSVPGMINPGTPAEFISNPIPTGNSYSFLVFDDNSCDTVVVAGMHTCPCVTAMGSMNQTPIIACEGETISVPNATGYVEDPNDDIIYVLHTGDPLEYIVVGNGTSFVFAPPLETGVTYLVTALIGNMIPGGVDLDDPCLAITPGPSVMWQASPTGSFSGPTDICTGDGAILTFTMTGIGPFTITYLVDNTPVTVPNVNSPYTITVYPDENTSYTFSTVTDNGGTQCTADVDITIDIAVGDAIEAEAEYTICEGETIFLGGEWQDSPGIYYDTFPGIIGCDTFIASTLFVISPDVTYVEGTTCHPEEVGESEETFTNIHGCDSLVITTLELVAGDTTYQYETSCDPDEVGTFPILYVGDDGCDSLNIVIVTLLESDTTYQTGVSCNSNNVGTFTETLTAENGCDSVVITTVTLVTGDTTHISGTSCHAGDVGVYTETYAGAFDCDSTVITTITYAEGDTTYVPGTTCDMQQVGVFENTYTSQNGCDSIVVSTITLTTADTSYASGTSCLIAEAGVFTNTYTAQNGCDSVIITTITLLGVDSTNLSGTTCDMAQAGVFSSIYSGTNGCDSVVITTVTLTDADTTNISGTTCDAQQVGVFTNTYAAQNGCDSIVINTITITDADTTHVTGTTCDAQQVGVFTNTYSAQNGCDSIVIATITLTDGDTTNVAGTTCDAQQVGVFTNTYAAQNGCDSVVISTITLTDPDTTNVAGTTCDALQAGTFTNTYTGQNGCDSVVISTITLTDPDTTFASGTTCDAQQVGVFTTTYTGQNGCDSIVVSTITLTAPYTTNISSTTCDAQQVGVFTDNYIAVNGCDSTVITTITLTIADTSFIAGTTCDEQQVGVFTNTYTAQNGCDSTVVSTITLTTADTSFVSGNTCDTLQAGVFTSTFVAQNGCDSVVVESITFSLADTVLVELASCLAADTGTIINTYQSVEGCDSVVITYTQWLAHEIRIFSAGSCLPADTGTIVQQFVNVNGCDSTILLITPLLPDDECDESTPGRKLFIPSAFSPNHDGINDVFYVMSDDVAEIRWLRIYDRWGGLVFEKNNLFPNDTAAGWDGTNDGEMMNPGVFIWQANVAFEDGVEKTLFGDITLIR